MDANQRHPAGVSCVSQTPLDCRQVYEVVRNEELSHDEPHAQVATECTGTALRWEVTLYMFIHSPT